MRIRLVITVFALVWAVLLVRIYFLSIKSNTYFEELAKQNTIKTEPLLPVRGLILDRNKEPLAVNRLGFSLALPPGLYIRKKEAELAKILGQIASMDKELLLEDLLDTYKKQDSYYNHDYIKVVDFIPYDKMHALYTQLNQIENIQIIPATKRYYPYSSGASHIVGYTGKANLKDIENNKIAKLSGYIGKNGLEKTYNEFLQGSLGYKKIKVTAFNEEIEEVERIPPSKNNNLILAMDIRVQKALDEQFDMHDKYGAAVVMDARNGEIIAAGSYPGYNTNDFVDGISFTKWDELINDPHHPFTNKLINGLYPPGSTIKMGVALSFLENNIIGENDDIFCPESLELGSRKFRDWKEGGHGYVDMRRAIRRSADVYFYKLSLKSGIDSIAKTLKDLGLGNKTGVDLPNEFVGIVPDSDWKEKRYKEPWYTGETLVAAIGQGYFLTTPLQIAKYTAALATGEIIKPHFVKYRGDTEINPEIKETLSDFQKEKLQVVREGMYGVCNDSEGTAYWHTRGTKVKIGCKTGTAQVVSISQSDEKRIDEKDMEYFHRSHAWLTAFAPYENPKYVITVMVEHGGHGGEAAGSVVKNVINTMYELNYFKDN